MHRLGCWTDDDKLLTTRVLLQIIEKEPSIIEEYDPYRSWHGSQYGSRYSLHGGRDGHNKGYTSGGSTIHSNRSDRY